MNKETLHDRAKRNLKVAKKNFKDRDEDEIYLNVAGYHLQQAVELEIKHRLETNGAKYQYIQDIGDLLDALEENTGYYNDTLRLMSPEITRWESRTRYIKDYFLNEKAIMRALPVIEKFIKECEETYITNEF